MRLRTLVLLLVLCVVTSIVSIPVIDSVNKSRVDGSIKRLELQEYQGTVAYILLEQEHKEIVMDMMKRRSQLKALKDNN